MMEAPIRLFEHFKTGRYAPRITVYALTLLFKVIPIDIQMKASIPIVRSGVSAFASPIVRFACPGQGVSP